MSTRQVLIVGAGPTGLVLALRLASHGVPFRIVDKNSGPGQASRAMAVQARTLEFYQQLGFADEIVARGIKIERLHFFEGGQEVVELAFGDLGKGLSPFPFVLSLPQDDHERFLVEKLKAAGIAVEWDVELQEFAQDDSGVRAVLDKAGRQEICDVAYLCGCDGAHSRVRRSLNIDFPGGAYSQLFYVADVKIEGDFRRDLIGHLGANSLALMFPVRRSGMQRLIGIVPLDLSGRTDLTFQDIRPSAEPLLHVHVTEVNWFSTYQVHHRVAEHFRIGRCFIAGDAAHIHSPAGGQGMNTGIGDAVNLSWKLADVLQHRAPASILDSYGSERMMFARKLVASTDKAFQAMVGQGKASRLLRVFVIPNLMPFLTSFSAVRRKMFKIVSQILVNYRKSSLSVGKAGDVRGGDRLPWVESGAGGNFAALRSLRWQLHVYGKLGLSLSDAATALDLPVQVFAWSDAAEAAGLKRDATYLLRPDGYIALAEPAQDGRSLSDFVARRELRFGQAGPR